MVALHDGLYFRKNSSIYLTSFMRQELFLKKVQKILKKKPKLIISELKTTLKAMTRPGNALLHVATDSKRIKKMSNQTFQKLKSLFNDSSLMEEKNSRIKFIIKPDYEYQMGSFDNLPKHVAMGMTESRACELTQSIVYKSKELHHKRVCSHSLTYNFFLFLIVCVCLGLEVSKPVSGL